MPDVDYARLLAIKGRINALTLAPDLPSNVWRELCLIQTELAIATGSAGKTAKMPILINIKTTTPPVDPTNYVYIGRPSKWGNPFRVEGDRDLAIRRYEHMASHSAPLLLALPELVGKTLGCFCVPQPCHGHVLIKLMIEQGLLD